MIRTESIQPVVLIESFGQDWADVSWSRVPGAKSFTFNIYNDDLPVQSLTLEADQTKGMA